MIKHLTHILKKMPLQTHAGKKALLIAPFHDAPTGTSSIAARSLIDFLKSAEMEVTVLEGNDARFKQFQDAMALEGPFDLCLYFGHGGKDSWRGQQPFEKTILMDLSRAWWLSGSIVVSVACLSLDRLGPKSVVESARGYLGFDDLVVAPSCTQQFERNYRADFIRTFMSPVVSLVAEEKRLDAVVYTFRELCISYRDLYYREGYQFSGYYAWAMMHNASTFDYLGNPHNTL